LLQLSVQLTRQHPNLHLEPPTQNAEIRAERPEGTTSDQPQDQPSKYLYYARAFWLYLQNQIAQRGFGLRFICV
jgi:hypothetical protein